MLRYRGYYYDFESELYYLQTRYYDPLFGRFLNSDVSAINPQSIFGFNTYAFCNNNPVGFAYSGSGIGGSANGGMMSLIGDSVGLGIGAALGPVSSWFTSLPAVPKALKHISKVNDVFSSVVHSIIVGKYFFGNGKLHKLSFLDEMRMIGVNPSKGLSALPKASFLNKICYTFAAIDGVITIYDNLQQGNTLGQALLDGVLSFGTSAASAWVGGFVGSNVGGMIGAAIGSMIPIPGVGAFLGFAVGAVVGVVVSWFVDDVLGLLKDGLLDLIF